MKYAVVGDIHGEIRQLTTLLNIGQLFDNRQTIFLGDYVDVGFHSKDVLDLLSDFQKNNENTVFLKGNHESFLEQYLETGELYSYAIQGGLSTIKSFTGTAYGNVHNSFQSAFKKHHIDFLASFKNHYITPAYIFAHCIFDGITKGVMAGKMIECFIFDDINTQRIHTEKKIIYGHYFQKNYKPYMKKNKMCIDTGCGIIGGPLTCLMLPENDYFQVQKDLSVTKNRI